MSQRNAPPAYDDHKFANAHQATTEDVKSHFTTTSPTSATSGDRSTGLAGPQTFAWVRNGTQGAKIYFTQPPSVDHALSHSSGSNNKEKNGMESWPDEKTTTPSYNLDLGCRTIVLYPSSTVDKSLMSCESERMFSTRSVYYDDESPTRRSVQMYRATGEDGSEPDGLFSKRRTFDDFNSYKYKWSTAFGGDQQCIRLSDGAVVASFKRAHLSFQHMGQFTLHKPVPEKTLQLLLITCGACYQLHRRRRNNAIAPGSGAGGGP